MGRVARLILLVVVSVCVVFCVLCCLQNNPVFLSVTYLIISKMKIMSYVFWRVSSLPKKKKIQLSVCWVRGSGDYDRKKKDTVVCLLGARSSGDYDRKKKRYSRLSGGLCCCVSFWDALIVSIQMILVGRIIHPAKPYMYSLSLENEPTSSNSHLTRNKK